MSEPFPSSPVLDDANVFMCCCCLVESGVGYVISTLAISSLSRRCGNWQLSLFAVSWTNTPRSGRFRV